MKKYILISVILIFSKLLFSQSNWDGKYPWYSADRYGDIRRGITLSSFSTEAYHLDKVKNINKFQNSMDTLIFLDNDKFFKFYFDFENKKVTVINFWSKTTEVYDILKVKKRKVNKDKTEGIFILKIKRGDTKINYYINTYDKYFCKIIYSKKEKIGVVLLNDIDGTSYKTDD